MRRAGTCSPGAPTLLDSIDVESGDACRPRWLHQTVSILIAVFLAPLGPQEAEDFSALRRSMGVNRGGVSEASR